METERPFDPDERPLPSSFGDDAAAQRTGVYDQRKDRKELHVLRPYDAAAPKQHSSIRRRLSKRASLRESFLVKEILDRPLALRRRR
jgi:hypothetical protein